MASAEVGGGERKPTKLPKWEAAWPGRRRSGAGRGVAAGPHPRARAPCCPGGHGVGQAPGVACPRPRRDPGSAWAESSHPELGQARRRELGPRSTTRQAAQEGPEGWEKPQKRLGWTSEFRGQPSPPGGRGGERCSQGCGRGGPGPCGGPAARGWGERALRRSPLFKLAQVGERRPGWRRRPPRAWPLGCVDRVVAFGPDTLTPRGEAASHSRTLSLRTPGAGGAPRRNLAPRTRARPEGAGRPSSRRLGAHPRAATPQPAHAHPRQGPSARRGALGSSQVSLGTERKATKQRKQHREGEGGAGARVLWTRLEWVGGTLKGLRRLRGVARGLRAQPPRAVPLPSPSRAPGSLSGQFLPPPLGPSQLRRGTQSWGLKERREGKREGKGRGGGERRTIPPKAGVEFQLGTLGPNCTPPPGPCTRRLFLSPSRRTSRWCGLLSPGSFPHPATPPLCPASPAPLSASLS